MEPLLESTPTRYRQFSEVPAYSCRWQTIMLLLHSLHELDSVQWKYDVADHIKEENKYEFDTKDFRPGTWCNTLNDFQPKWVSDLDCASRICMGLGFLHTHQSEDSWQITRKGKKTVHKLEHFAKSGVFKVNQCYLWSRDFKGSLDPTFVPSKGDPRRPKEFYDLIQDLIQKCDQRIQVSRETPALA